METFEIRKSPTTLLLFFFFTSFIKLSYSQTSSSAINWTFKGKFDGVEFYHVLTECSGKKAVFLKFDNKNDYAVKVAWKEVFKTQFEDKAEGFAGGKELVIPKGITMPTGCADAANTKNVILASAVNPTYVAEISSFDYKDIAVTPVQ